MKICIHVYLNISDFPYLYELLKVLSEEGNAEPEVKFMWFLIHFVYTLVHAKLKEKKRIVLFAGYAKQNKKKDHNSIT